MNFSLKDFYIIGKNLFMSICLQLVVLRCSILLSQLFSSNTDRVKNVCLKMLDYLNKSHNFITSPFILRIHSNEMWGKEICGNPALTDHRSSIYSLKPCWPELLIDWVFILHSLTSFSAIHPGWKEKVIQIWVLVCATSSSCVLFVIIVYVVIIYCVVII